jgi:hypothetical protein
MAFKTQDTAKNITEDLVHEAAYEFVAMMGYEGKTLDYVLDHPDVGMTREEIRLGSVLRLLVNMHT